LLDEVRIWLEGLGALDWAERFAARHSMTLDRLVRPKRGPTHAAVQAACDEFRSVLRDTHALSFPELASGLRLKHHDPVMSSCRRHEVRRVAEFAALVRSEA
jgi:hypothetical protein